ncbi:MAG: hypothetical protein P8182_18405 [Deltaproteobacteria bacterium]
MSVTSRPLDSYTPSPCAGPLSFDIPAADQDRTLTTAPQWISTGLPSASWVSPFRPMSDLPRDTVLQTAIAESGYFGLVVLAKGKLAHDRFAADFAKAPAYGIINRATRVGLRASLISFRTSLLFLVLTVHE